MKDAIPFPFRYGTDIHPEIANLILEWMGVHPCNPITHSKTVLFSMQLRLARLLRNGCGTRSLWPSLALRSHAMAAHALLVHTYARNATLPVDCICTHKLQTVEAFGHGDVAALGLWAALRGRREEPRRARGVGAARLPGTFTVGDQHAS